MDKINSLQRKFIKIGISADIFKTIVLNGKCSTVEFINFVLVKLNKASPSNPNLWLKSSIKHCYLNFMRSNSKELNRARVIKNKKISDKQKKNYECIKNNKISSSYIDEFNKLDTNKQKRYYLIAQKKSKVPNFLIKSLAEQEYIKEKRCEND